MNSRFSLIRGALNDIMSTQQTLYHLNAYTKTSLCAFGIIIKIRKGRSPLAGSQFGIAMRPPVVPRHMIICWRWLGAEISDFPRMLFCGCTICFTAVLMKKGPGATALGKDSSPEPNIFLLRRRKCRSLSRPLYIPRTWNMAYVFPEQMIRTRDMDCWATYSTMIRKSSYILEETHSLGNKMKKNTAGCRALNQICCSKRRYTNL